ncbi:uncharacterized protein BDZ83DRAFT_607350 [Colletotrichum acutatum]|uniref:Uncharacterized protein n=1 Tax=Glomerella acutata TaxID=27357 RepID=A0AAD8XK82_GLOAC|nr:uncharacterized protein BDZ83DRAFT_607350 [Colletotrichum acutatum]KAK1728892.1 hypothetical protein BDZ83DRAFT_607350 [Colletotrichum acutatum]
MSPCLQLPPPPKFSHATISKAPYRCPLPTRYPIATGSRPTYHPLTLPLPSTSVSPYSQQQPFCPCPFPFPLTAPQNPYHGIRSSRQTHPSQDSHHRSVSLRV